MGQIDHIIPDRFRSGLAVLLTAFDYAQDSQTDPWQFAVELPDLLSKGATLPDLRWLILRKFAEHGIETTVPGDAHRTFRPLAATSFPPESCIVLSSTGATAIRTFLSQRALNSADWPNDPSPPSQREQRRPPTDEGGARPTAVDAVGQRGVGSTGPFGSPSPTRAPTDVSPPSQAGARGGDVNPFQQPSVVDRSPTEILTPAPDPTPSPALKPFYNAMLHELRLGDEIVKRFTRPAPAQELILAAFQEEGWPPAIDDPLPSQFNQDPKRRLHYTVRNLNRGQKPIRIRFFINGNGETIRWKLVAPQRAKSARRARKRR